MKKLLKSVICGVPIVDPPTVIITLGDSINASGYYRDTVGTVTGARWAHLDFVIDPFNGLGAGMTVGSTTIEPMGPLLLDITPRQAALGSWKQELAAALVPYISPVFIDYGWSGAAAGYFDPTADGNSYAAVLAFIRANLSRLPALSRSPVVMFKIGSNSSVDLPDGITNLMSQLRSDLGYTLPVLIWRLPPDSTVPSGFQSTVIAAQNAYVASDARSAIFYDDDPTYIIDGTGVPGQATGIHPDHASLIRAMTGPDSGSTKCAMTALHEIGLF